MKSINEYITAKNRHVFNLNEVYNIEDIDWELSVTTEVVDDAFRQFLDDLNAFIKDWVSNNTTASASYFNDE